MCDGCSRAGYWILWAGLLPVLLIPVLTKLAAAKNVPIWQVEQTANSEVYSNGLRIDTRFTVPDGSRRYSRFSGGSAGRSLGSGSAGR